MANEEQFQKLKEKYVSVLSAINKEDLQVQNLHVQDGKLFIRAVAPNESAKTKFWDAVKHVDANFSKDFHAEISVKPPQAQAQHSAPAPHAPAPAGPTAQPAPPAAAPQVETYTVQKGDTLSAIAKRFYGSANQYTKIFEANRDQLKDPDKISPGQVLKIPAK